MTIAQRIENNNFHFTDRNPLELIEKARNCLKDKPPSLAPINHFCKALGLETDTHINKYAREAETIINRRSDFEEFPGSLHRLLPLALKLQENVQLVEKEIQSNPINLKKFQSVIKSFHDTYLNFRSNYVVETMKIHPYEPCTIWQKYPITIKQFTESTLNWMKSLPNESYEQIKEAIETSDPMLMPLIPRLTFYRLLECPTHSIPEMFSDHEYTIENFRKFYTTLKLEQRKSLLSELTGKTKSNDLKVHNLFLMISTLCFPNELNKKNTLYGIIRVASDQLQKSLPLIQTLKALNINYFPENNLHWQHSLIFLALLKHEHYTPDTLPQSCLHSDIQNNLEAAHKDYQALPNEKKEKLDKIILSGTPMTNVNTPLRIFNAWKAIYPNWINGTPMNVLPSLRMLGFIATNSR